MHIKERIYDNVVIKPTNIEQFKIFAKFKC